MTNEQVVTSFFFLTNKLKDNVKRKGWYDRNIKRFRVESVADHIFGSEMLAYAMYSEFDYDVDINKVILMISLHELEETIIGDLTPHDISRKEKKVLDRKILLELLKMIPNGDFIKDILLEYETGESKEAKFAYQVEHAECDMQAKLYAEEGCFSDSYTKEKFVSNWIGFDLGRLPYDDNFRKLLEFVMTSDMKVLEHQDNPFQNVISFYTLTNSLKDKKRKGEEIWKVNKDHYGSVAEHVYSVQMLEIITYLVYGFDVDIKRVSAITSIHELGEIINGDICSLNKTREDRESEFVAAKRVASILTKGDIITKYLEEFNSGKTKEAVFSKYADKLAPDIISKIYDQMHYVDLNNQNGNSLLSNPIVSKHIDKGFSSMWILYGEEIYNYPEPFMSISRYALENTIDEHYSRELKKIGIESLY